MPNLVTMGQTITVQATIQSSECSKTSKGHLGDGQLGFGPGQRRIPEHGGRRRLDAFLQDGRDHAHGRPPRRLRVDAQVHHVADDAQALLVHALQPRVHQLAELLGLLQVLSCLHATRPVVVVVSDHRYR